MNNNPLQADAELQEAIADATPEFQSSLKRVSNLWIELNWKCHKL